jgi:hypothetical protein
LLPNDALGALIDCQTPTELEWIFFGRWLFADRPHDADILADGRRLVTWTEGSLSDLLPLWSSLFRG